MASITARNCYKVEQASRSRITDDGDEVRTVVSLRSDGKVLRQVNILAERYRDADYCARNHLVASRCWNRSGYSIIGSVPMTGGIGPIGNGRDRTGLEFFRAWYARHGYTRDDVKVGR